MATGMEVRARRGGQRVRTCAGSINSQSQAFTALVVKVLSEKESVCRQ